MAKKEVERIRKRAHRNDYINPVTNRPLAQNLEDLPSLKEGYVRVVHQGFSDSANNIIEKGLIYNREYAGVEGNYSKYTDLTSMATAFSEDGFWDSLSKASIQHRGADKKIIFDMPMEECGAHQNQIIAQHLNGTLPSRYAVGVIDNYGTDSLRLSSEEVEKYKAISKQNPSHEVEETPNWRENIKTAWEKFESEQDLLEEKSVFGDENKNFEENAQEQPSTSSKSSNTDDWDFSDWDDFSR